METKDQDQTSPETITYDYTSEGELTRLIHIPTSLVNQSLALCGDKEATKFFMWTADYGTNDVTACRACQSHEDLPLLLLGLLP